jgi:polysaccharide deacetylase 2 family uncharacterized protein YibQ
MLDMIKRALPVFLSTCFIILAFIAGTLWMSAMMRGTPAQASIPEHHETSFMAPPQASEAMDAKTTAPHTALPDSVTPEPTTRLTPVPMNETGHARIAIIIDDMGLNIRNSRRAVAFDSPLTLSYLPYARDIQAQVDTARARGHEIMLHLPMEPFDRHLNAGPTALTTRLNDKEFTTRLTQNLTAFQGYVGINNHMGSRVTSTPDIIDRIMHEIARHDVYFVDSWTSPRSVAYASAANMNIPRGRRDVFLDHDDGENAVWAALRQAERIARTHGAAVAIGHPKTDTLNVLGQWIPGAIERGVQIVPMSRLIYRGPYAGDPVLQADARRQAQASQ